MRAARILTPVALLAFATTSPLLAEWASEKKAFNEAFRSSDPESRAIAVEGLKDADHAEGARFLIERFLAERNDAVLAALGRKICDLGSDDARECLRRSVLNEPDGKRRAKLSRIFAEGRGLDRVDVLRKLLADRDPAVRAAVAGFIGAPDTLLTRHVAALATDPEFDVRRAALRALGRIATLEAVEPLILAVEHETSPALRDDAVASLRRITDRNYGANAEAWRAWWRKHRAQDLSQVDRAIYLGAEYLRGQMKAALDVKPDPSKHPWQAREGLRAVPVMTYALIHAGVDPADPAYKAGLDYIVNKPADGTYNAALIALALSDLDADRYAARLTELAQMLSDQQCVNGQWSYGTPQSEAVSPGRKETPAPDQESGPGGGKLRRKASIPIAWRENGRGYQGDNSNTQFAILGLRATTEAGCAIPKQVWERALGWWFSCQEQPYGGWGYMMKDGARWSMTCSGMTSVTICLRALGKDEAFRNGRPLDVIEIQNGADWLKSNWLPLGGPNRSGRGGGGWGLYYDLYSLERVGMICGLDKIGDLDWYAEGCEELLGTQGNDGSWGDNPIDTAFAILFLKKATKGYAVSPQDPK